MSAVLNPELRHRSDQARSQLRRVQHDAEQTWPRSSACRRNDDTSTLQREAASASLIGTVRVTAMDCTTLHQQALERSTAFNPHLGERGYPGLMPKDGVGVLHSPAARGKEHGGSGRIVEAEELPRSGRAAA